jgi:F0F1-type ATP synthase assembly protein I
MEPKKPARREPGLALQYGALGNTFAFSIMLFAGAGYLLDRWLGLLPILTIVGTLVGTGMAVARVYLRVRQDAADNQARLRQDTPTAPRRDDTSGS